MLLVAGAVLGVTFQALFDRIKSLHRDGEVWYRVRSVAFLPERHRYPDSLQYLFNGVALSHPHRVEVLIWRMGGNDISRADFGELETLDLHLGTRIITELAPTYTAGGGDIQVEARSGARYVSITKGVFGSAFATRLLLLTEGAAQGNYADVMPNVKYIDYDKTGNRSDWLRLTLGASGFAVSGTVLLIAPFVFLYAFTTSPSISSAIDEINREGFLLFTVAGIFCLLPAQLLWSKSRAARSAWRKLRSRVPNVSKETDWRKPDVAVDYQL